MPKEGYLPLVVYLSEGAICLFIYLVGFLPLDLSFLFFCLFRKVFGVGEFYVMVSCILNFGSFCRYTLFLVVPPPPLIRLGYLTG